MNHKTKMALRFGVSALIVLLAAGCNQRQGEADTKLQAELFFKCMEKLPKGPEKAIYNDWDEVVAECGSQARIMSWRCVKNCS